MKKILIPIISVIILITPSCKKAQKSDNPFFNSYDTPFDVPPFEKIKAAHYMPAYIRGFEEQKKEIKAMNCRPGL